MRAPAAQEVANMPRAALVFRASESLVLKLMGAHAFRTPTVIELFGSNTYTTAPTDIDTFEAERQDTFELAADWRISRPLKLRANGWLSRLDGSIGYSVDELFIVNRYDAVRAGGEVELTVDARLGPRTQLDGWLSWSFAHHVSETTRDPDLVEGGRLTRAPWQTAKLGARLRRGLVTATLQGLFVGDIHRRDNDLADDANRAMRDAVVPAWLSVDAALHVRALDWLRAGVVAKNVFGSGGKLPAIRDVPFDYPVEPRRILVELGLDL
jgi:outer membrane receptor protein involved in Fe transport